MERRDTDISAVQYVFAFPQSKKYETSQRNPVDWIGLYL
jgi:hypothetical protein